jgi:hypothetical protein
MLEMTFGSGSPMWTAMPSVGLPYQQMGLGALPSATPAFSPPVIAGGIGGSATGGQGLGLAVAYPFASNPFAAQIADATGVVTASSLLAAVAMRRGQPQGPTSDAEVEEFIYDAIDLLPGASDVEIRCESGRVTLTGSVQHKRTKRDAGELAWAIPGLHDVQNNVSITSRRRARAAGREAEAPASVSARKQG